MGAACPWSWEGAEGGAGSSSVHSSVRKLVNSRSKSESGSESGSVKRGLGAWAVDSAAAGGACAEEEAK